MPSQPVTDPSPVRSALPLPASFAFILSLLAVCLPCCLPFAWHHATALGLWTLAATFVTHAALLYGTLRPNNRFFGPLLTAIPAPRGDEVWLTVDDGPDPHDTPRLLDLLGAADARATFFVRGDRASAHPELVREILRRGHGLGNHTDTHPQAAFWCLGPRRMAREISGCQATLRRLTGMVPTLFRAPVGMVNPFVHPAARACGLRLVGWSARGFDGVSGATPPEVVRRILADLRPGGIALLHEGRRGPNGEAVNVRAMQLLLVELQTRRWRAVLPSALNLDP